MKSVATFLLMVAVCCFALVKGSENTSPPESFKLVKSPNEWWVARHWRKNGQDTYLTTHTRIMPAIGAHIFNMLLEDVVLAFDETEEKFRTIKQACQTYELKSVVSEKYVNENKT